MKLRKTATVRRRLGLLPNVNVITNNFTIKKKKKNARANMAISYAVLGCRDIFEEVFSWFRGNDPSLLFLYVKYKNSRIIKHQKKNKPQSNFGELLPHPDLPFSRDAADADGTNRTAWKALHRGVRRVSLRVFFIAELIKNRKGTRDWRFWRYFVGSISS